jgi:hypothetical protein
MLSLDGPETGGEHPSLFILSIVSFSFGSYLTHILRGCNAAEDTLEHASAALPAMDPRCPYRLFRD